MSRSGYSDCCDGWDLIRWRGAVNSAIRGKKGQAFLRELAAAMDAMPVKELITGELVAADGGVCAIGAVCQARGLDVSGLDVDEPEEVAKLVGIARAMAAEIEYENDERSWKETPAQRWQRMRKWVDRQLAQPQDMTDKEAQ